jgi:uncharacterized BrkB/YihY/UPF0761 family membrane protein
MTKKEFAVLACRIFALYAFLKFIFQIESVICVIWGLMDGRAGIKDTSGVIFFSFLLTTLLLLALAIVIWKKAEWLAEKIFPGKDSAGSKLEISMSEVQIVAFSVVGLVLIVEALPQIGNLIVDYKMRTSQPYVSMYPFWRSVVMHGIEFLLGFGLLFGSKGLAGLLKSFRKS